MKVCRLDGRQRSKRAVLRKLGRDLGWDRPLTNLDALYDVLRRNLSGPIEVSWRPSPALGADADPIAAVLRQVAAERADFTLREGF